jgi:hypothetical protein
MYLTVPLCFTSLLMMSGVIQGFLLSPSFLCHSFPNILDRENHPRRQNQPSTQYMVSELHIPGYAKTKLPFLLSDFERSLLLPTVYSKHDYESFLPFQDGHLLHRTTNLPILSPAECRSIVEEAESQSRILSWTTRRHGNFPTTDLPLVELPQTLSWLRCALVERIYPLLSLQFGTYLPDVTKLRVADGFVVKYDADGGQTELKPHRDGSVLSFNIALNPSSDFDGGGTWFASIPDYPIRIDQGHMVSHASGILHGGHGITRGKRYILVAFVIVEGYSSWSMRFYNQVRNK